MLFRFTGLSLLLQNIAMEKNIFFEKHKFLNIFIIIAVCIVETFYRVIFYIRKIFLRYLSMLYYIVLIFLEKTVVKDSFLGIFLVIELLEAVFILAFNRDSTFRSNTREEEVYPSQIKSENFSKALFMNFSISKIVLLDRALFFFPKEKLYLVLNKNFKNPNLINMLTAEDDVLIYSLSLVLRYIKGFAVLVLLSSLVALFFQKETEEDKESYNLEIKRAIVEQINITEASYSNTFFRLFGKLFSLILPYSFIARLAEKTVRVEASGAEILREQILNKELNLSEYELLPKKILYGAGQYSPFPLEVLGYLS